MIGRSLRIGEKVYTIIAKATWGNYYYLASPDDEDEEPFIRPMGVIHRAFELGQGVEL